MSAAARQARLVAAMAQAMPCCGRRMVVVVQCCQNSLATLIDVRARALLLKPSGEPLAWGCCSLPESRRVDLQGSKRKRMTPEVCSERVPSTDKRL